MKEKGLEQVTDTQWIDEIVNRVIQANPKVADDFRSGKKKALSFLVGQVMRETRGRAKPELVLKLLQERLSSEK